VLIDIDFENRYKQPYDHSHGGPLAVLFHQLTVGEDPSKQKRLERNVKS